jgi:hypothetical protein
MTTLGDTRRQREIAELTIMQGLIGSLTEHVCELANDGADREYRALAYHSARMYLKIIDTLVTEGIDARKTRDIPF